MKAFLICQQSVVSVLFLSPLSSEQIASFSTNNVEEPLAAASAASAASAAARQEKSHVENVAETTPRRGDGARRDPSPTTKNRTELMT